MSMPILGSDFLPYFHLFVNVAGSRLLDTATNDPKKANTLFLNYLYLLKYWTCQKMKKALNVYLEFLDGGLGLENFI